MPADQPTTKQAHLILVLGGAASGKSALALGLSGTAGKRAFVATGQALDEEMAARIRRHRAERDAGWETAEVPVELAAWFETEGRLFSTIVLDCLTLWLANLQGHGVPDEQVDARVAALITAIKVTGARVIVVTNELGLGLVPADAGSRRFRDVAGRMNQTMAQEADEVYFVVSGVPIRIKPSDAPVEVP